MGARREKGWKKSNRAIKYWSQIRIMSLGGHSQRLIPPILYFLSSTLGESPGPAFQNVCVCVCLSVCLSPISRPLIGWKYRGGGYGGGWACRGLKIWCSLKQRKGWAEFCHTQSRWSLAGRNSSHEWLLPPVQHQHQHLAHLLVITSLVIWLPGVVRRLQLVGVFG